MTVAGVSTIPLLVIVVVVVTWVLINAHRCITTIVVVVVCSIDIAAGRLLGRSVAGLAG